MPMALGLGLGLPYIAAASGPYPALDLNFATMATLDSRVTYSGASLATLTDATGAIAYKPHNLFVRSEELNSASWTKFNSPTVTANTAVAPDGATTADSVTSAATGGMYQFATLASGVTYTISCYAKQTTSGGSFGFYGQGGSFGSTLITPGSTWARHSFTFTASAAGSADNGLNRLVGVDIWGAQLNVGPLQPYYPTTSAAYFGPRFTYDPVTHAALGLLIEEQRTNLAQWSEDFSNAAWSKSNVSVTANAATAPDGNATADKAVEINGSASPLLYQAATLTAASYTVSVFAKAAERSWLAFRFDAGSTKYTWFNLGTGAVGTVDATHTATIKNCGNGWYRCTVTATGTAAPWFSVFAPTTGDGVSTYTGNGTSGIYLWGAQLEAGAFATSYIPTTSASVTRAADSATMTGSNFSSWFNATQGTFVVDAQFGVVGPPSDLILAHDGSTTNSVGIYMSSSKPNQAVNAGGVSQTVQASGSAWTLGATSKVAASFAGNDFRTSNNGAAVVTDSVGSMPSGLNSFSLGGSGAVLYAGTKLNAPIARLRYYNTALTNAQLQALTT